MPYTRLHYLNDDTGLTVRIATEGDAEAVQVLYRGLGSERRFVLGGPLPKRAQVAESLASGNHLVGELSSGEVLGVSTYTYSEITRTAALKVAVTRQWRRHGVGTAMVQSTIDVVRLNGFRGLIAEVAPENNPGRRLFETLSRVKPGRRDDGVDVYTIAV